MTLSNRVISGWFISADIILNLRWINVFPFRFNGFYRFLNSPIIPGN
ncbi:MAG: hypothetical protein ACM3UT_13815 [Chloroflexota bacterium]